MIKPESIYKYYMSEKFNPEMPDMSNFRHFRFKLPNGTWRKVPEKIKTKEELLKWIIKFGGCDVYYSVAQWLNPHVISAKGNSGSYYIADNLVLNHDLVFDIDAFEPITIKKLNDAKKLASKIYKYMKNHERFEFDYFSFTGYKGFRLVYKDKQLKLPQSPRSRFDFIENERNIFIQQALKDIKEDKENTMLDVAISTNLMCVIRVNGTINSKTGYLSTNLPVSYLNKKIEALLDEVPYIGKKRPVIPKREMKSDIDNKMSSPRAVQLEKDVSGLASFPNNHQYFITNRVLGIKRGYVPFFTYSLNHKYYKKELHKLQIKYNLGNIYTFKTDTQIIAISLKTMQSRRLIKVLNESSSHTKHHFKKYKRIHIPFSVNFDEVLYGKYTGNLSKGHSIFINHKNKDKSNLAGWDEIELVRAER